MKFIQFQPNQPQSFIMPPTGPYKLPEENSAVIPLPGGDWLFLASPLGSSLGALKLQPGEEFAICLYQDRGIPHWECWLTPGTEKARAAVEMAKLDLETQLRASLKVVQGRKERFSGEAAGPGFRAPTGTEGPVSMPAPSARKLPAIAAAAGAGRKRREGPIPLNIAFREVVQFVVAELKDSGEQWSDQCRQDLISTALIAAQKLGLLSVWEREDEAA